MRKTWRNMFCAAVIGMALPWTSAAFAAPVTDVAVTVNVNQVQQDIDWVKDEVRAEGYGVTPAGKEGPQGRLMARRAALVDAYRNLTESIYSVQITSESTVRDHVVESDVASTQVRAVIHGARVVGEEQREDGVYVVKIAVDLHGSGSVAEAVADGFRGVLPAENAPVSSGYNPAGEVAARAAGYTGVIIDASGLGLEGSFSPVIYDTAGRAIYGARDIDKAFAISKGMVEYSSSVEAASGNSRAGSNPLVVRAVEVRGGGNSANPINTVVSVEDGDAILFADSRSGFLGKKAVVFVK